MANLRLCAKNAIDFSTLTVSPTMVSTATVRPSNLLIQDRGLVARTASPIPASQVLSWTWNGQGYYLNHLMLNRHNFETGATIRWQLFSDLAWTTQIYDSGTINAYDFTALSDLNWGVDPLGSGLFDSFLGLKFSNVFFARVLAQSGRLTINNSGNSNGFLEAARLWGGDYTELSYNPQTLDHYWGELTKQTRTPGGGGLRSDSPGVNYRCMDFDINFLDPLQRVVLSDMGRYAGLRKDLFISVYPGLGGTDERDHTMICKFFGNVPKLSKKGGTLIMSTKVSVQEA